MESLQWLAEISLLSVKEIQLLSPTIGTGDVISIAGIVIVIAVPANLQPTWKAAGMDPIAALRHV